MDLNIAGKKAIVTGGSRGIGKAIVQTLAAEGVNVIFCARQTHSIAKTVEEFKNLKGNVVGESVDISDHKSFKKWIASSIETLGGLDILIHNAGAMVAENTEQDWKKNIDVDLLGAVYATEVSKPFLAQSVTNNGDAAIVYISSVSASEAYDESSYGPIKAALIHFAKGVAKQNANLGIRANVVSPGPVYFNDGFWQNTEKNDPQLFKLVMDKAPLHRMAKPKEIADAVAFLSSPLSAYTTGINLVVDGGFTSKVSF